MSWLFVLLTGLVAGTLGGIVGFGGSTILLPVLALTFGAKAAVPIMAVAAMVGNLSRVAIWWREINWRAAAAFSVAAIPGAWLGAMTMLAIDAVLLEFCLGVFFIAMIPLRRWFTSHGFTIGLAGLALAGCGIGFLTGIVSGTGPINTPFFLAHGLARGAFIGTEAMSSVAMFSTKVAAFHAFGALPRDIVVSGLLVGSTLMIGAYLGKRLLMRLADASFRNLMDMVLLVAGLAMIASAGYAWTAG